MLERSHSILAATPAKSEEVSTSSFGQPTDYSTLLASLGVRYRASKYYWQVGEIKKTQGWILHLSVIKFQLYQLAELVLPFLIKEDIPFKIARTDSLADKILNGAFGNKHLAKVICIYPEDDHSATHLAERLIVLTKDFKGPHIPTDFCLGNIVYTRYGAFAPVIVIDQKGNPIDHIYNAKAELIPDPYHVPFSFPSGVQWPFSRLVTPTLPDRTKLLNGKYYPISTIKYSSRGRVLKAIYFRKIWNIRACVIKEAKQNMGAEMDGRDASSRLHWQLKVCAELGKDLPLPKIFDCFIQNGDTYLTMEFIKGKSLGKWRKDAYNYHAWFDLPDTTKQQSIDNILQIVSIIRHFHKNGFVHRDITETNFILTRKNKIIPIDLELAWSSQPGNELAPFLLGTPGFMSPQQATGTETPTAKDDIYALGALLVATHTNMLPIFISSGGRPPTIEQLLFFTHYPQISEFIVKCLKEDPAERPDLETIQKELLRSLDRNKFKAINPTTVRLHILDQAKLKWTIQAGLNALGNSKMLSSKGYWVSLKKDENILEETEEKKEMEKYVGWHTGMAGPLWLLALAKSNGFVITDACEEAYNTNWDYISSRYLTAPQFVNPSLYFGTAGIAMAMIEGLKAGLLSPDEQTINFLNYCFAVQATGLTLSSGISGQGIALLKASDSLNKDFVDHHLSSYISQLLSSQQQDGSWHLRSLELDEGTSGVILFLLTYLANYADHQVETSVRRALNWLIATKNNKQTWKKIQKDAPATIWVAGQTAADITLIMLRAFKVLGDTRFKDLAEINLKMIPDNLVCENFTLHNGLTRIGELYLEAYKILKDPIWLEKATWFANLFLYTFISLDESQGYWAANLDGTTTADLFQGNSGIIHFLLRFFKNEAVRHLL